DEGAGGRGGWRGRHRVDGAALVRVLAVAQLVGALQLERQPGRKGGARRGGRGRRGDAGGTRGGAGGGFRVAAEPFGHGGVVALGVEERLDRQLAAQRLGHHAVARRPRRQQARGGGGRDHPRDAGEVLGRRPPHRRAADVDLLDHLVERGGGVGGGL